MNEKDILKDKVLLNHLNNHDKPVTRRDFLSLGFIGFSGLTCFSNAYASKMFHQLTLNSRDYLPALADDPSFLVYDLSGGAALVGNFLVGNKKGPEDLLTSYSTLGWDPRKTKLDKRFGLPMPEASVSKIFQGLIETMSEDAQKNFRMASICHQSSSDSSRNPLNAMSLVVNAGARGEYIGSPLGSRNSASGGRSQLVLKGDKYKPIHVKSSSALSNMLGLGDVINSLPKEAQASVIKNFGDLSSLMAQKVSGENKKKFDKILKGSTTEFEDRLLNSVVQLDARFDENAAAVYNINQNTSPTDRNVVFSSISMNAIKGVTGPGVLEIGGCDYHDGTFTRGDAKDLEIGQAIGRSVELAKRLEKPLFVQIITDGGIYSRQNARNWRGDSDDRCMTVIGYYDPKRTPTYTKNGMQLGNYTNGEGADRSTLIGNSPTLATYAAFANYLNVCGRIDEFQKLAPGIFSANELKKVLLFEA